MPEAPVNVAPASGAYTPEMLAVEGRKGGVEALTEEADGVTDAPRTILPLTHVAVDARFVMPEAPVNVAPASGAYTPEMLAVDGMPVRFAPLPKKAEAVTDAPLTILPLTPVAVNAWFVMPEAPVNVAPASGAYTPEMLAV